MAVVVLLTYTSSDEDLKKGRDSKKSKIQKPTEAVWDLNHHWMWWWGLDNQLGVGHGDTEGNTYESKIIFFGGSWGKDKKNSIIIILTFEVLIGHPGGAILHVVATGVKYELVSMPELSQISPMLHVLMYRESKIS